MDLLFSNVFAYLCVHNGTMPDHSFVGRLQVNGGYVYTCDFDNFDMRPINSTWILVIRFIVFHLISSWIFHRVLISGIIFNNNLFTFSSGPLLLSIQELKLCFIAALPCSFFYSLSSFILFCPFHTCIHPSIGHTTN